MARAGGTQQQCVATAGSPCGGTGAEENPWKVWGHRALDGAGFIPGIGSFASAADAGWYLADGEYQNADWAATGIVPGGKYAGKLAKGTVKTFEAVRAWRAARRTARSVEEVEDGTRSLKLADGQTRAEPSASGATDQTRPITHPDTPNHPPSPNPSTSAGTNPTGPTGTRPTGRAGTRPDTPTRSNGADSSGAASRLRNNGNKPVPANAPTRAAESTTPGRAHPPNARATEQTPTTTSGGSGPTHPNTPQANHSAQQPPDNAATSPPPANADSGHSKSQTTIEQTAGHATGSEVRQQEETQPSQDGGTPKKVSAEDTTGQASSEPSAALGEVRSKEAQDTFDKSLDYASRPENLDHVFVPKHKLDPLGDEYGSREGAMKEIVTSLEKGSDLPEPGVF